MNKNGAPLEAEHPKVSNALLKRLATRDKSLPALAPAAPEADVQLQRAGRPKPTPVRAAPRPTQPSRSSAPVAAPAPAPVEQAPASLSSLRAVAKRPKRLLATLVGVPFPSKSKRKADVTKALYTVGSGVMTIGDKEFTHVEPVVLGTAAAIAGVTSIVLKAEGLPADGLVLNMRNWQQRELDALPYSVQYFFKRARTGYDLAKNSHKQPREAVDRCQQEYWAPALGLLPPEMRVLTGLRRGVYDDDGRPMTTKTIEQRARSKRMIDAFKGAIAKLDDTGAELDIVFAGTTQLLPDRNGDEAPVVYTHEAELSLKKLVSRYEFGVLPLTRPQLDAFVEHVNSKILLTGGVALLRGV